MCQVLCLAFFRNFCFLEPIQHSHLSHTVSPSPPSPKHYPQRVFVLCPAQKFLLSEIQEIQEYVWPEKVILSKLEKWCWSSQGSQPCITHRQRASGTWGLPHPPTSALHPPQLLFGCKARPGLLCCLGLFYSAAATKATQNTLESVNYRAQRNSAVNRQIPLTISMFLAGGVRNVSLFFGSWICTPTPSFLNQRSLKSGEKKTLPRFLSQLRDNEAFGSDYCHSLLIIPSEVGLLWLCRKTTTEGGFEGISAQICSECLFTEMIAAWDDCLLLQTPADISYPFPQLQGRKPDPSHTSPSDINTSYYFLGSANN